MADQAYTIRVNVIGDRQLSKFQTSIDKMNRSARNSQQSLQRMSKGMSGVSNALRRMVPLFASAFSVSAVKNVIQTADAIGKVADATGLTVEGYQELKFAAEQSGVSQSQFNSNMTAFVKRVGEAQNGMGPLVSGLKNMNSGLLDGVVAAESQEEALRLVADAVENAESATEKAAIANAAFGRSGVAMVNMLRDGRKGLDGFAKQARDLGLVMSEDLVRSAEQMNDALNVLTTRLQVAFGSQVLTRLTNFKNGFAAFRTDLENGGKAAQTAAAAFVTLSAVIAGRLLKAIALLMRSNPFTSIALLATTAAWAIIENWDKVAAWFGLKLPSMLDAGKGHFYSGLAGILTIIRDWAIRATEIFAEPINALIRQGERLGKLNPFKAMGVKEFAPQFEGLTAKIEEFGNKSRSAFESAGKGVKEYRERMDEIKESADNAAAGIENTNIAIIDMGDELDNVNDKCGEATDEISDLEKALIAYEKELKNAADANQLVSDKIVLVNRLFLEGKISVDTYKKALDDLDRSVQKANDGLGEMQGAMEETGKEKDKLRDNVIDFSRIVEDALGTVVVDAAKSMVDAMFEGGKDIGEILEDMIKTFARLVAEVLATEAAMWALDKVFGALGKSSSGMFGGGGGMGGGGGFGSILGTIGGGFLGGPIGAGIGGALGGLLPFARGGVVPANMLTALNGGFVTSGPMKIGFGPLTPAARGMLIGEAGSEAVLPLKRGASGRLGVEATGGNVSVQIHNYSKAQVRTVNTAREDGGREISFYINDMVQKEIKRGGYDRTLRGNYNLPRRGF